MPILKPVKVKKVPNTVLPNVNSPATVYKQAPPYPSNKKSPRNK